MKWVHVAFLVSIDGHELIRVPSSPGLFDLALIRMSTRHDSDASMYVIQVGSFIRSLNDGNHEDLD